VEEGKEAPRSPEQIVRPPVRAPKEPPPPESTAGQDIVASLDRSLGGIAPEGDLSAADRLEKSERSVAAIDPKSMKAPKLRDIDVEIRLPTVKDIPLTAPSDPKASVFGKAKYDPEKYQASLRDQLVGIEGCYARHEKRGAPGRISVWFSIGSTGAVKKSGVESNTFKNTGLEGCILDRIGKVKFDPPPWDGFTTSFAFRFGRRRIDF
jgi:hypothetical protein